MGANGWWHLERERSSRRGRRLRDTDSTSTGAAAASTPLSNEDSCMGTLHGGHDILTNIEEVSGGTRGGTRQ